MAEIHRRLFVGKRADRPRISDTRTDLPWIEARLFGGCGGEYWGLYAIATARVVIAHYCLRTATVPLRSAEADHRLQPSLTGRGPPFRVRCGSGEVPFTLGINGAVAHAPSTSANNGLPPGDFEQAAEMMRAAQTVVSVPVVRLDDALAGQEVALLKIDCEGFEQRILAGARRIIKEQRPHLFLELHPAELGKFGGSPEGVLAELESYYDLEFWDFSRSRCLPRFIQSLIKHRRNTGWRLRDRTELLSICQTLPLPPQLYVLGHPKR